MENVKDFLKSCICVEADSDIYFLYDKQTIRNAKLNQILNKISNINFDTMFIYLDIILHDATIVAPRDFSLSEVVDIFEKTKYKNYRIYYGFVTRSKTKLKIIKNVLL